MADGSSRKPIWRELAPHLDRTVSPDLNCALALHHLELAAAYFGALDLEARSDDDDNLTHNLRSNAERFKLVMKHMDQRYPSGNEDFRAAAAAFFKAINDHWDAVWREEYGPGDDSAEDEA